jgi:hypothetical protein
MWSKSHAHLGTTKKPIEKFEFFCKNLTNLKFLWTSFHYTIDFVLHPFLATWSNKIILQQSFIPKCKNLVLVGSFVCLHLGMPQTTKIIFGFKVAMTLTCIQNTMLLISICYTHINPMMTNVTINYWPFQVLWLIKMSSYELAWCILVFYCLSVFSHTSPWYVINHGIHYICKTLASFGHQNKSGHILNMNTFWAYHGVLCYMYH